MNLDQTTVVIRPRSLLELHDLALVIIRRHWWPLTVLALISCSPFAAFDLWLLWGYPIEYSALHWWLLLLLVAVQGPLATAPLSAYLGQAVFSTKPSIVAALRSGVRAWWSLLLAGVLRLLMAVVPPVLMAYPSHWIETAVLEGTTSGSAWRRANALRHVDGSGMVLHWLMALLVLVSVLVAVVMGLSGLISIILGRSVAAWADWMPTTHILPHVAVWMAVAYLAVVRFLNYIDLRTRHEGWDLGLMTRRAGERLTEGG